MIKRDGNFNVEVREQMKGGPGSVVFESFFSKNDFGGEHVRVCARLTVKPGCGIGLHAHNGEDEVFIIVSGRGKVNDNGTIEEVEPGDTVLTGKGGSHAIECIGEEPLVLIAVVVTY